jgi:hypothetical protein
MMVCGPGDRVPAIPSGHNAVRRHVAQESRQDAQGDRTTSVITDINRRPYGIAAAGKGQVKVDTRRRRSYQAIDDVAPRKENAAAD